MKTKSFMALILESDKRTLKKWLIGVYIWGFLSLSWPIAGIIMVANTNDSSSFTSFVVIITLISTGILLLFGVPISLRIRWLNHHVDSN